MDYLEVKNDKSIEKNKEESRGRKCRRLRIEKILIIEIVRFVGGKQIIVYKLRKFIKYKDYIHCYKCNKDIKVKEVYRKESLDYLETQQFNNWVRKQRRW